MCIGIPMKVVEGNAFQALCERAGTVSTQSMLLVGEQKPGTWVLTHLGSVMRVLEEEEARLINDALEGLAEASDGQSFDHLFADLIGREPQLPEHLRDK